MTDRVLITGASRGIGRAAAAAFGKNGYDVIINYNSSYESAKSVCDEIIASGGNAMIYRADVSDPAQVNGMLNAAGGVDILVNNAGIAEQSLFTDITEEMWDRMFNVNIKGIYLCTRAFLPYMLNRKRGRIINISSVWGVSGASCEVHYSASKAAVIGFTKALAKETGLSGITVNCIAPGVIDTDMNMGLDNKILSELKEQTPLNRLGRAEDIAGAILFLASEEASFITGQTIIADGGFTL